MRKGLVISLAVLLVVFLAIGCTDTGTDNETDEAAVPPADEDTVVPPTDEDMVEDNETVTDDQAVDNETTDENMTDTEAVETTEVEVNEDGFDPETIRVMIGDTVTWTNTGQEDQTVTSDEDLFDSGMLAPGDTFTYTFEEAGTYDYSSEEDLLISGSVIVEPGEEDQQTDNMTTVPSDNGTTNITAEDRGYETTSEGNIIVESDQPTTTTNITPDEEDNNTL